MKKKIYIGLFALLYLIVAFSSLWHAIEFFGLANNTWMAIILAFAFEIGQAAVLFALLTSPKDRHKVMPWVLMTMFTLVQVLGNVYSSYKHIILNSVENLRFFKEPIFIWTQLPDEQATVIITYLVGGLLPISSLLLTSMITNYLENESSPKKNLEESSYKTNLSDEIKSQEIQEEPKEILSERQPDTSDERILRNDPKESVQVLDDNQEDKKFKKTHLIK